MISLALAAGVVTVQAAGLLAVSRGRSHTSFVLAVLPAALLLIVLPVPLASLQIIRTFQGIAAAGSGGLGEVSRSFASIARPLPIHGLALALVMVTAAFWQRARARDEGQSPELTAGTPTPRPGWRGWFLLASVALLLPSLLLVSYIRETMAFVIQLGSELTGPAAPSASGRDLGTLSGTISNRLIASVLFGFTLSGILMFASIANVLVSRSLPGHLPGHLSWAVAAGVAVAAVVMAWLWGTDVSAFVAAGERAASLR